MTKTYELPNDMIIMAVVNENIHVATVSVFALDYLVGEVNKTGHWIEHEIKDTCRWLTCSECGYEWVNKKENFCPNCGARMIEGEEV